MRYGSRIDTYTMLPPKRRIVYSEDQFKTPAERYLKQVDETLKNTLQAVSYKSGSDLISLVFTNQALVHAVKSGHLAQLLTERKALGQEHLAGITERLDELKARVPWRAPSDRFQPRTRPEQELERIILDLERQKRDIELTLWRDALELRRELVGERQEYKSTRDRMTFLSGGSYAGP